MSQVRARLRSIAAVVGMAFAANAMAQSLREEVEAAWTLDPHIAALQAKRNELIARREAAGALFPAPPAITLSYATDQAIEDNRQRSAELEISTPLWLPGERAATQQTAEADILRIDAQLALTRLTVAGAVRDAVFAHALAVREAELAQRRVENARALEADVARRVSAGEVAALELDLARSELFAAEAEARKRQAQAAAARTSLLSLTGLGAPPTNYDEPLAADTAIVRHPQLQVAERSIEAAQASVRLVDIATRSSPEIGVFTTRTRDTFARQYDTAVGLRLRFPFSTRARNAPRQAAAEAELNAALAQRAAAERKIRRDVANAKQALASSEAQTPLVDGRLKAMRQVLSRLQLSYDAGNIGLFEVLRARVALFDAEIAQARNRLAVAQARSRVDQALGVVP